MRVVEVRVEQRLENRLSDRVRRHARVVPSLDNQVDGEFNDRPRDLTGRLVEDEGKVVFREVRVSWVASVPVVPHFLLIMGSEDCLRGLTQSADGGADQRLDEWLECGDDKDGNIVRDLLD